MIFMNNETKATQRYSDSGNIRYPSPESILSKCGRKVKTLLRDTPIEAFLIGTAGAVCATMLAYSNEVQRSHKIPLAFSEISQLEKQAKAEGKEVGAMTQYYAKVNDVTMKTLEAWNNSWANETKDNSREFAKQLGERMVKDSNYGSQHTYTITDLLEQMPMLAENASKTMEGYTKNISLIQTLNRELDATWTTEHQDHYRTETYWDTENYTTTDGSGDNRHTVSHSRQVLKTRSVYDHTTHTYNYHPENGEKTSALLGELKNNKEYLAWPQVLSRVKKINQPNQDAIVISRTKGEKVPKLSKGEISDLVNTWNHGSTYNQNKDRITSAVENIPTMNATWQSAKATAKSVQYDTNSRSDSGPSEYQRINEIKSQTKNLESGISEIMGGINQVSSQVPGLKKSLDDYVHSLTEIKATGTSINPKEAQKAIIKTVESWYSANIKEGFNMDMFRWHRLFLWGLFGAVAGGLVGAGLDKIGNRYDWYGNKERDF